MPAAEVDVSADLVRRLLADQHPDLASLPVSFLASGWDNAMYRLGPRSLARLPRRALGAEIIVNEQRWLPLLAPRLPLPIPVPERTGRPALGYPYSWSVVPFIPGRPAADALDAREDGGGLAAAAGVSEVASLDIPGVAASLGGFLGALHARAPAGAPVNPFRGVPLGSRAGPFAANVEIAAADPAVTSDRELFRAAVLRAWADALAAPGHGGPRVWLHGDLHPANILVEGGRLSGVIDWGDINAGDPACDLSVAWMMLAPAGHGPFRAAYGDAGGRAELEALWRRARGWALHLALAYLAHSADNPQLHRIGRRTLAAVLAPGQARGDGPAPGNHPANNAASE